MGGGFHQVPVVAGDFYFQLASGPVAGQLQDAQVFVDKPEPGQATPAHFAVFLEENGKIRLFGQENRAYRFRSRPPVVAVQAADALQQHVHRAQVGHQPVGVDVQALFQGLGADEQEGTCRRVLAHAPAHFAIQQLPVGPGVAAMVGTRLAVHGKQGGRQYRVRIRQTRQRQGAGHGVQHHHHPPAGRHGRAQVRQQGFRGFQDGQGLNTYPFGPHSRVGQVA